MARSSSEMLDKLLSLDSFRRNEFAGKNKNNFQYLFD